MKSLHKLQHQISYGVLALALAATTSACRQDPNPATFQVTVPNPNTVQMQVGLTQRFGIALSGTFPLVIEGIDYGSIYVTPESPSSGLGFGFTLNTNTFLRESWVNYQEVTTLPTGDAFPSWHGGPVVDVVIPPANISELSWHFYFGTRTQFYVGAAAVISAIGRGFPAVRLEYSFYDNQGRVIIGIVFFGPKLDASGNLLSPGGIYVGTNITPFLPENMRNIGGRSSSASSVSLSAAEISRLISAAHTGKPVKVGGRSVTADLAVSGRDSGRYRSAQSIQGLADRFAAASRRR
jgi:hypothetical protein